MKKLFSITELLLLLLLFFTAVKLSFAQTNGQLLFNMSTPVMTQKINSYATKITEPVVISPFTTVFIPTGSFSSEVTMYAYAGNVNKIKLFLPSGQSIINSYYFVFKNSANQTVKPDVPIIVQATNNYIGTNTFFYPVGNSGINTANQLEKVGHVTVNSSLPDGDFGFILATNKIISPDDSSLNPKFIKTPTPAPPANQPVSSQMQFLSSLIPTIVTLIIVVAAIGLLFSLTRKKRQKNS